MALLWAGYMCSSFEVLGSQSAGSRCWAHVQSQALVEDAQQEEGFVACQVQRQQLPRACTDLQGIPAGSGLAMVACLSLATLSHSAMARACSAACSLLLYALALHK